MNKILLSFFLVFATQELIAQAAVTCPPNIGFEQGNFNNWDCFDGFIRPDGSLDLQPSPPMPNVHTIIQKSPLPLLDPYGEFPISCPNGSNYSIQLGNDETGRGAERISYTFHIPMGQDKYSIIYNYAVVIENPAHQPYQQPKFMTEVFDVTAGEYIDCASFEFVASANLPGFLPSPNFPNVFYKPWAAVTIDLNGMAGRTLRIEFTNNDCTQSGHFGYAYLDINENCNSPIKGNVACGNSNSITLRAPFGFQEYKWYDATLTNLLGTSSNLTISPVPPPNTTYAVVLIPYPGLGCLDTIYTNVSRVADVLMLNTPDTVKGCSDPGVNLAAPSVTAGSSPDLTLSYFSDPTLTTYIQNPNYVTESGDYYINAVNTLGCNVTKKVYVQVSPAPNVVYSDPVWGCEPNLVDITNPMLYAGSDPGLALSYWTNSQATSSLSNPAAVGKGSYFVKATDGGGCSVIKPLSVDMAKLVTRDILSCNTADLTLNVNTAGSSPGFDFTYWMDSAGTVPVTDPKNVITDGRYFIRGAHNSGCVFTRGLEVKIISPNNFVITDPPEVKYPGNVDLTKTFYDPGNLTYTYWRDLAATKKLETPTNVTEAGTYYIKAMTADGCAVVKPVVVRIKLPDPAKFEAPNAFSPNGDGVNDVFTVKMDGHLRKIEFRIYNRWGHLVFFSNKTVAEWNGKMGEVTLPTGVYYWILNATDSYRNVQHQETGSVTLIR